MRVIDSVLNLGSRVHFEKDPIDFLCLYLRYVGFVVDPAPTVYIVLFYGVIHISGL